MTVDELAAVVLAELERLELERARQAHRDLVTSVTLAVAMICVGLIAWIVR